MPLRAAASFWAVTVTLSVDSCAEAEIAATISAAQAVPDNRNERNMENSKMGSARQQSALVADVPRGELQKGSAARRRAALPAPGRGGIDREEKKRKEADSDKGQAQR